MIRVAILVSHLSGTGHLVRSLALARALAARGAEAWVLSGGRPLAHLATDGLRFVQLPWLAVAGLDYARPRRADGRVATEADLAARREAILDHLARIRPGVLVVETWPFGRRRLDAEHMAAVEAVRATGGRLAASVRDVPEPPRSAARLAWTAERVALLDGVIVHGEAGLLPLSASFPLPEALSARIRHTGYVAGPPPSSAPRSREVLVSGGGGAPGHALARLAARAARFSDRPWRILTPLRLGPTPARVEGLRRDYPRLLAGAAASVSRAGYNTAVDLAGCRTPAVLVPFEAGAEREQAIRGAALARLPGVTRLPEHGLTPERLAAAAERAAACPRRPPFPMRRDGAGRAAAAILDLLP